MEILYEMYMIIYIKCTWKFYIKCTWELMYMEILHGNFIGN